MLTTHAGEYLVIIDERGLRKIFVMPDYTPEPISFSSAQLLDEASEANRPNVLALLAMWKRAAGTLVHARYSAMGV